MDGCVRTKVEKEKRIKRGCKKDGQRGRRQTVTKASGDEHADSEERTPEEGLVRLAIYLLLCN